MEEIDDQLFVRDFLRKVEPPANGMAQLNAATLNHGELQLCLLLIWRGPAAYVEESGADYHLPDSKLHESRGESLASRRLPL